MTGATLLASKEVETLVQHIELNRSGWWDKTVQRLVLAAIWMSDKNPDTEGLRASLEVAFKLKLSQSKLSAAITALENTGHLIHLPNGTYRIPDEHRQQFEKELADSELVEAAAQKVFFEIAAKVAEAIDPPSAWRLFNDEFLIPLIRQVGVNAYQLIAGERIAADRTLVDGFLAKFPADQEHALHTLVTAFLDPKTAEVRAYISRLLHARFCVEASGLPEAVINKLTRSIGKPVQFRMFVDTNFLFSLMELHENPSNAAAQELRELLGQLNGNPTVSFVVTPRTVNEAKGALTRTKAQVTGVPSTPNFSNAALNMGVSGMATKFFLERVKRQGRLSAAEWFDPFLNNFVALARGRGVEIFNEKTDSYATRQDVVDDISDMLKFEERRPPEQRKSYEKVAHDVILWHFVNDKRPAYVESPTEANEWILTVDFRLIGYDQHKRATMKSRVPLCIHPSSLVQLLQFWIPRTQEFEEAMLGSLRLPFLFQDFDAAAEQTSLKILKGIGRFAGDEEFPEESITQVIFNDGLRARLQSGESEDAEIELIKDALVDALRSRMQIESDKNEQLSQALRDQEALISKERQQREAAHEQLSSSKRQSQSDQAIIAAAEERLQTQGLEMAALQRRLEALEKMRIDSDAEQKLRQLQSAANRSFSLYVLMVVVILFLSYATAVLLPSIFPKVTRILGPEAFSIGLGLLAFSAGHWLIERRIQPSSIFAQGRLYRILSRIRHWAWKITIPIVGLGVLVNVLSNSVQKNIDREATTPGPPPAQTPPSE